MTAQTKCHITDSMARSKSYNRPLLRRGQGNIITDNNPSEASSIPSDIAEEPQSLPKPRRRIVRGSLTPPAALAAAPARSRTVQRPRPDPITSRRFLFKSPSAIRRQSTRPFAPHVHLTRDSLGPFNLSGHHRRSSSNPPRFLFRTTDTSTRHDGKGDFRGSRALQDMDNAEDVEGGSVLDQGNEEEGEEDLMQGYGHASAHGEDDLPRLPSPSLAPISAPSKPERYGKYGRIPDDIVYEVTTSQLGTPKPPLSPDRLKRVREFNELMARLERDARRRR